MSSEHVNEFDLTATFRSAEARRKLDYLATVDSGSVQTDAFSATRNRYSDPKADGEDRALSTLQQMAFIAEQQRQQRMDELDRRLTTLNERAERAAREARERLAEIEENANRTIDGQLVFLDQDGVFRGADGQVIAPDQVDQGTWNPAGPSWEDFTNANREVARAERLLDRVRQGQQQLADGEISDDDLDALTDEIAELEESSLAGPNDPLARTGSAATQFTGDTGITGAERVSAHFSRATSAPATTDGDSPIDSKFSGT